MTVEQMIAERDTRSAALSAALTTALAAANDTVSTKGGTVIAQNLSRLPMAIASIPQGGEALINGRRFECGTFTFPATVQSDYTIQHTLGATPSAVFLWVVDPDYSVRGQLGKFRADSTFEVNSVAITAINGGLSASTGGVSNRFRTGWDSTTIKFNADSTYPLLPSMEYQWLAIAQ